MKMPKVQQLVEDGRLTMFQEGELNGNEIEYENDKNWRWDDEHENGAVQQFIQCAREDALVKYGEEVW